MFENPVSEMRRTQSTVWRFLSLLPELLSLALLAFFSFPLPLSGVFNFNNKEYSRIQINKFSATVKSNQNAHLPICQIKFNNWETLIKPPYCQLGWIGTMGSSRERQSEKTSLPARAWGQTDGTFDELYSPTEFIPSETKDRGKKVRKVYQTCSNLIIKRLIGFKAHSNSRIVLSFFFFKKLNKEQSITDPINAASVIKYELTQVVFSR